MGLIHTLLLLLLLSHFSHVRLCVTPWTAAYQAPPSMGFSRQEYWSGLPLPSPGEGNSYPLKEMATHSGTLGTEKPGRLYVLAVAKSRTRLSDFTFTFQYSSLEDPTDRGAWRATVHGVAKSRTQLSNFHFRIF